MGSFLLFRCALVATLSLCALPLLGQPPRPGSTESRHEVEQNAAQTAEVAALIEQLGAASFAEREQATDALYGFGTEALPQLRRVGRDDLEKWMRAQRIADRIEREQFDRLAKSFLLDSNPEHSYGLPAWYAFADCCGTSRSSKLLYLEMLRLEPELVGQIQQAWDAIQQNAEVTTATDALRAMLAQRATEIWHDRMNMQLPEIGQFVAILVGTSLAPGQAPSEVNALMEASINMVPFSSYLNRRGYSNAMRRLLGVWVPKSQPGQAEVVLSIALRYDIESGVEVARKSLNPALDARTRQLAIMTLARFGEKQDVAALIPNLRDPTVCEVYQVREDYEHLHGMDVLPEAPPGAPLQQFPGGGPHIGPHVTYKVLRLCDLALTAVLMLSGEDPTAYFPGFQPHDVYGIDGRSIAGVNAVEVFKERDEKIQRWLADYRAKRES